MRNIAHARTHALRQADCSVSDKTRSGSFTHLLGFASELPGSQSTAEATQQQEKKLRLRSEELLNLTGFTNVCLGFDTDMLEQNRREPPAAMLAVYFLV